MKKYILICDDDKKLNNDISSTLTTQLAKKEENVEIIQVYTKESAIDQISKRYFSLAIIDLNLEGAPPADWSHTGGVQVIERIRKLQFNTKILVVSASPETELSFSLGREYGIDFYIQKGQSTSTFRNLVNKSIELTESSQSMTAKNPVEVISGLKGDMKTIWESNMYSNLHIEGNLSGLLEVINTIMKNCYPFKYLGDSRLEYNVGTNVAYGEVWSYILASEIGIYIYPSNKKSITNRKSILEKTKINNVVIEIIKLDLAS